MYTPFAHLKSLCHVSCMRLGDGEPDMDFPAIDKTMKLKAFNLNEFCLCTASDDAMPPPPPPPSLPILGPVANRPVSVRSMPQHVHGPDQLHFNVWQRIRNRTTGSSRDCRGPRWSS